MPYSDLHCHPFLRPYEENDPTALGDMPSDPGDVRSVWHTKTEIKILTDLEQSLGFVGYTESDFGNVLMYNNGAILVASHYAVESGFFQLKKGTVLDDILRLFHIQNISADLLGNWVSRFKLVKIESIEDSRYDYFNDLLNQFNYASTQAAFSPHPAGDALNGKSYSIASPGEHVKTGPNDIKVVFSIEGGNCLWHNYNADGTIWDGNNFDASKIWNGRDFAGKFDNNTLRAYQLLPGDDFRNKVSPAIITGPVDQMNELIPWAVCSQVLQNLKDLKTHASRPFFITLGHHFYNGVCGHAASLQALKGLVDQSYGMNSDITNLGWMIINEMLQDAGNRILVDVKHMSWRSRQSYYAFRQNYYQDVPIIFSHGAVFGGHFKDGAIVNSPDSIATHFYKQDINLYDEDIANIVSSGGLIGLEIDQRINGAKADGHNAEMIGYNMLYIVKQASALPLPAGSSAWDFISLGTDYDGIINPTPGFGTAKSIYSLKTIVNDQLTTFLNTDDGRLSNPQGLALSVIMDKIFYKNVMDFVNKYYK